MTRGSTNAILREWLPAALGATFVVGASVFAMAQRGAAREAITELHQLSDTLMATAAMTQATAISPDPVTDLPRRRAELESRAGEAMQPATIQAELMTTARAARVNVREIQPVPTAARADAVGTSYPAYRVRVSGDYAQIAEYMQRCKAQRVPARVVRFTLTPELNSDGAASALLAADITVEIFQLPTEAVRLVKN